MSSACSASAPPAWTAIEGKMAADLHAVYTSEVERGTKAVSMETLWRISKTLRVPLSQLVREV